MKPLENKRVLLVGVGGLGSPASRILAREGVGHLTLIDDDRVDMSNLQRQTLYREPHVGSLKVEIAAETLQREARSHGHPLHVATHALRLLPENALELIAGHDLVLEGGDNFATKFLVADACALSQTPLVQAGAVRWSGWALGYHPGNGPCLRCIFEDIPRLQIDTCATAGVVGPVVGVLGALQAALALRLLLDDREAAGEFVHYNGLRGALRRTHPKQRRDCPACAGSFTDLDEARYMPPECAA